ncbi:oligopeptide/dipeptide ABC transporter ATP-binding protein, partial [Pseudomonas aeruginosa]
RSASRGADPRPAQRTAGAGARRDPGSDQSPAGCRFSSRCPQAGDLCRREAPALREVAPGHRVACHWVAS